MTKRHKKTTAIDLVVLTAVLAATCLPVSLNAWDHPSHMTTAAIAFADIERMRPDLMERIGLMLMSHPDPAPFWVAASGATSSKERARRMFIEGARWPDDAKGTTNDRLSWHSARFPIVADDAPQETKDLVAADGGDPDFRSWALEAHQIAVDFAYGSGIEFVKDPDPNMDAEKLVGKMIKYVLFGESPLDEAPDVPAEYWAMLQEHAHSQIALAGYRIADVIVAAADKLLVERTLTGDVL